MRTLWRITRYSLVIYLALLLLLMIFEESLIFFPSKHPSGNWEPVGLSVEDANFNAADGTRLHGWYVEHQQPRAVILFAHGNAGNLTHRADVLRLLHQRLGVSAMIFDYRGYGRSEGVPDEQGILQDARAARRWLADRTGNPEAEIVLLGRSLGGGVMVDLAAQDGARALMLESTFTSLPDVAASHYPWAPVRLIMRTHLDSLSKIPDYHGPLLQSHSKADEIIPYQLGARLHEAAPDPHKKFLSLEELGHNDPQPASYYDQLDVFLNRINSNDE